MTKFKPGQSGNPKGRTPGNTYQTRLKEAIGPHFDTLIESIVTAALTGDMQAANLILTRIVPAIRPVQEPAPFPLSGDTLTDKALSVLESVSAGHLSAMDGKLLLDALAGVVRVQDAEQLQKQLELIKLTLDANQVKP